MRWQCLTVECKILSLHDTGQADGGRGLAGAMTVTAKEKRKNEMKLGWTMLLLDVRAYRTSGGRWGARVRASLYKTT